MKMESRDSTAEDGRSSPVTSGLAKEAGALFSSGRFSECVDVLNQLLLKKEGDPKVLHNIAVAEYFRDGCSDPRKLLHVLNKVKKRSEELAHSLDTSSVARADEFDTSIITLNTAIILYHLHEYARAFSILEPLYQNIDPIDETIALHVCLLLLDIALASHDAPRAADVIQYLEKCFGVGCMANHCDNGNTTQQQSPNPGGTTSTMSNSSLPDASSSDSSSNVNENSLSGALSDDALEFESLYSTLDGSSQNLGRPSKASADRAAPAIELKLKMHLYKVRLFLLSRNLKAAKREVKLAMNMARGRDSSTELLLKSQLEYAHGNHRKAVKLLMTSSNGTEPGVLIVFNNNLGCIHYQLRSHHTSGLFFSKALKASLSLSSEKPLKLSTFSQGRSLHIIYNCGIQNLACGKPLVAARCFGKASLVFSDTPLQQPTFLWLRLAECCLLAFEKGLLRPSREDIIRVHVAGSGRWRQLVVDDLNSRNGYYKTEKGDVCKLSLPFARYCLQNALLLLNKNEEKIIKYGASVTPLNEEPDQVKSGKNSNHKTTTEESKAHLNRDSKGNNGTLDSNSTLQSSTATYEDMQREEKYVIKQAVLGALAYVELCLENPLKALSYSKSLLELPHCSETYFFLSHIYAAEALCWLNRSKEAAEHLSVSLKGSGNVELPYKKEDREKWSKKRVAGDFEDSKNYLPPKTMRDESQDSFLKPEEARGVTFINFSAMFAVQGDTERASTFASEALSLLPKHPKALLMAVYIDLLREKTQEALSKLKQFNHVRYLSSDIRASS
ncbi:CCR4-NOT transcription complex subunit 10-like isoform X2 [Asparagus officinalis]|uniref:CCR4-NOT transcription complex subunit 10-like isoform X2 n=1 Tax=Asparagus officinalis TaxID=4686 RepID=UPI00098E22D1|nr:CCR4-NOT transcription complex subunit 10-like isoform X2 [Asparagus officinalis]